MKIRLEAVFSGLAIQTLKRQDPAIFEKIQHDYIYKVQRNYNTANAYLIYGPTGPLHERDGINISYGIYHNATQYTFKKYDYLLRYLYKDDLWDSLVHIIYTFCPRRTWDELWSMESKTLASKQKTWESAVYPNIDLSQKIMETNYLFFFASPHRLNHYGSEYRREGEPIMRQIGPKDHWRQSRWKKA